jgi:hypothetical protein
MDKKQAKETLIRLQKRLIINETNAQSFYTKFSDSTRKMFDLSKLGKNYGMDILAELFTKGVVSIKPNKNISDENFNRVISKINKLYSENESQKKRNRSGLFANWLAIHYWNN